MVISRERCKTLARKLTEKMKEHVDELEKAYVKMVVDYYNAQIPKEVHEFARKYPQHISFAEHIDFDGHGFRNEYVSPGLEVWVVSNVENYAQAKLELTPKIADNLIKAKRKWQDAKKELENLKRETEVALRNLRTTKRIEAELPVAAKFLPGVGLVVSYPVPALRLGPLKAKLAKLNPEEKTA